ncbi:MAG: TIGR02270 family protein [Myxococcota bacterium]
MAQIIPSVVSQHIEQAGYLWARRCQAARSRNYDLGDLEQLDERVDAHVDGLLAAGCAALPLARDELSFEYAEDAFSFGFVHDDPIAASLELLESGMDAEVVRDGIGGMATWRPWTQIQPVIEALLRRDEPALVGAGLVAASGHGRVYELAYQRVFPSSDPLLLGPALCSVGAFRRHDYKPQVVHLCQATAERNDVITRLSLAAAVLLGLPGAERRLLELLLRHDELAEDAWVDFAVRANLNAPRSGPPPHALVERFTEPSARHVATAAVGDPRAVPQLMQDMEDPEQGKAAFMAFCMITGADHDRDGLVGNSPAGAESGPTDDPDDEEVELPAHEDLEWPDVERVRDWWSKHAERFTHGQRYLVGRPIGPSCLPEVLAQGYQHQRRAAALESALRDPQAPLFQIDAPAWRQRACLGPDDR